MNKKYISLLITIIFLAIFSGNIFGQKRQLQKLVTIESVIKDDAGTPVPNAVISAKEGATQVLSDADGRFTIEVPENTEILVEAEGFDMISLPIAIATQGVTLNRVPFLMDQANMVNVPFGKMRKKQVVGAVSTVDPKKIAGYDNTQYVLNALISRVPGLLGSTNIRGIGNAVIVVDGIPRDPSNINLEEIEQVTVLKDANSSVLYGSQAKNGVILITTKRGQSNKRIMNFSVEQGMSKPVIYPGYLNSADYTKLYNEAWLNDGLDPTQLPFPDSVVAGYVSGNNPYRYPSVDYYSDEYLKNSRPFSKILTEFSGGNATTRYYANIGWIRNGSLYNLGEGQEASYNRFNVRANVDVKVNDYINAFIDAVGIFTVNKNPLYRTDQSNPRPNGSFWGEAATLLPHYFSPLLPVNLIKANPTLEDGASLENLKLVNGNFILGGTSQYRSNVYGNMFRSGSTADLDRNATFNTGIEFDLRDITEGLKLKAYVTFDIYNRYNQNVTNLYAVYQPTWDADSISGLKMINKDEKTGVQNLPAQLMAYLRRVGTYAMLDYSRTFNGMHRITGTLLGYYDSYRQNAVIIDVKNSHLGLRLTYDYNNKYFVDFSSAYVNGFKLPPGNKGALSPTAGLAWVITEEDFLSGSNIINYLRLRASAGIINTEFGGSNYRAYEKTFQTTSSFGWNDGNRSTSAIYSSRAGNPDLTFEKMKNLNIGMEGYLFDRSLYIDANLFSTRYSGQVIQRITYPDLLGYYNRPFENYNETAYRGGEMGISWTKALGELTFTVGTNLLIASSEITKRDEIWEEDYLYREGRSADVIYGLEAVGFFASQADITASPTQQYGEVKPGDIKYKDQNGDLIVDARDQIEIGNSVDRISYGLNLNLNYKNFNLFVLGSGRDGAESIYSGNYFWVDGTDKYSNVVLNRWTPATASSADFPRLTTKSSTNNYQTSTFWLYADNYFTLDRLQISYDVPNSIVRKLYTKGLTVYLRGERVAEFMKDKDKRNIRIGTEPLYRNYSIGARIEF